MNIKALQKKIKQVSSNLGVLLEPQLMELEAALDRMLDFINMDDEEDDENELRSASFRYDADDDDDL